MRGLFRQPPYSGVYRARPRTVGYTGGSDQEQREIETPSTLKQVGSLVRGLFRLHDPRRVEVIACELRTEAKVLQVSAEWRDEIKAQVPLPPRVGVGDAP